MKGVIFTVFLDMVEEKFGLEMQDNIITAADPPNNGAYTAVGTYPHTELLALVAALAKETQLPVQQLVQAYGEYLFPVLAETYPELLQGINTTFQLLEQVDSYIHVEVKKLYPDANPPRFRCVPRDEKQMALEYQSPRCLGDAAEGLIRGCAAYFKEELQIDREAANDGSKEYFLLTRVESSA